MGNDVHRNPGKRHYDITMSRRTRKPLNLEESKKEILLKDAGHDGEKGNSNSETGGGGDHDNEHKRSLKQLIHGDGNVKVILGEENKCRSSLGQHFTEDKQQLQMVVKQQDEVLVGVKPKGSSVIHYIKVLSHLMIKAKQDSRAAASRKKPVIALKM